MSALDAIILGVVEGLTEFLPISSTGHLILAGHLLGLPNTELLKTFQITIQLGAIGAVVALFWRSFLSVAVLKRLAIACIPTFIIGFALYSFIKERLLGNEVVVVAAMLLGGILLIVFELVHREREGAAEDSKSISYAQAAGVGLFQSIAIVPGVSRSAASILGGLVLGFKRTAIVEFSFLLAVPTMAAATGLDMLKSYHLFSSADWGIIAIGFVTAFGVALVAMRFFLSFVKTHTFIPFGIYRIALALVFAAVFLL